MTLFFLRSVSRRIVLVQRRHGLPLVPRAEGLPRIKKGSRPRRAGINGRVFSREDRDVTHFSRYIQGWWKRAKSWRPRRERKSWQRGLSTGIARNRSHNVHVREFTVHIQRWDKHCLPRGQVKMWGRVDKNGSVLRGDRTLSIYRPDKFAID